MEKPTGMLQKIIENLQQINALDSYSPIEKDIILHNLRAAYMSFLNIKADEQNAENRVEKLFEVSGEPALPSVSTDGTEEEIMEDEEMENGEMENGEWRMENEENIEEEIIEEEPLIEEVPLVEEIIDDEVTEAEADVEPESEPEQEQKPESEPEPEPIIEETPVVTQPVVLQDDLLELIPDAKPKSNLLFDEMDLPKSEKKSLNDLLEKKEDNTLGAKYQQAFIPDLTKAIAINEKFTFIRELFQNSGVDFSNAIQKINECENIDTAFVLMEELKHQYFWDTTSSAYLSLCDLVRRRFI